MSEADESPQRSGATPASRLEELFAAEASARQRFEDLLLIQQVLDRLGDGADQQQLFEALVEQVASLLQVQICSLMLADEGGELAIVAACGLPGEVVSGTRVASGEGVAGFVFGRGEALLVADIDRDERFAPNPGEDRYRTRSLLSVPLQLRGRVSGVLNVNNRNDGRAFDGADLHLLTGVAHQVALAIENFRLVRELRRQAQDLEAANRDLQQLHQARSRLVCNLSHELKTPLTSVLGYLELVLNHFEQVDLAELHSYLELSRDQGMRMKELINAMLTLFSLDSGGGRWEPVSLTLEGFVEEALAEFAESIAAAGLQVVTELPPTTAWLCGDRDKLGYLVRALVDNAIKFNRPGGRLEVRVGSHREQDRDWWELRVANEGGTVPVEAAEAIFDQYTQLGDQSSGKPAGVGIGLSICRAIVARLGGRIALDTSRTCEGTSIIALLPAAAQKD